MARWLDHPTVWNHRLTTTTASSRGATSRISNTINGWLPSFHFRVVTSGKPRTKRGTRPTMRTANLPLRFCFSPALVVSMALTCPANRRTRNLSAVRPAYPGILYSSKCDLPFEPYRASSGRSSFPKSGDDRFRAPKLCTSNNVYPCTPKIRALSMKLSVAGLFPPEFRKAS
jgi:hypothetical protein